jgi:hypothetical protein
MPRYQLPVSCLRLVERIPHPTTRSPRRKVNFTKTLTIDLSPIQPGTCSGRAHRHCTSGRQPPGRPAGPRR